MCENTYKPMILVCTYTFYNETLMAVFLEMLPLDPDAVLRDELIIIIRMTFSSEYWPEDKNTLIPVGHCESEAEVERLLC